jgi:hypothetical protein
MKFVRGYLRSYGNNVWYGGDFRIVRSGSKYWGYTGYELTRSGKHVGRFETLKEAVAAAQKEVC